MKYLFLFLSIIILNGCGTDTGGKNCKDHSSCNTDYCNPDTNKCETKDCEKWEELINGECKLRAEQCDETKDCLQYQICNISTHSCEADPCKNQNCSGFGICEVVNLSPVCNCFTGYSYGATNLTCVQDDLCLNVDCDTWEQCIEGSCELKENRCVTPNDCEDWEICNNDHICEPALGRCLDDRNCPLTERCNSTNHTCENPCAGQECSSRGDCVVINHIASCNCNFAYTSEGLNCIFDNCTDGMCKIPAGSFSMGTEDYNYSKPVHTVTLRNYIIDQYEVTVQQFKDCVNHGGCTSENYGVYTPSDNSLKYCNYNRSGFGNHPMNCVSWNSAKQYCQWKNNKRLPTEAEWEYAARGNDGRKYPWGNQTPTCDYAIMNYGGYGCGQDRTWEVGSKPNGKSPFGLYDMSGNVMEWVNDWYIETFYSSSPSNNPQGPETGTFRGMRGGTYEAFENLRVDYREHAMPYNYGRGFGFRCAKDVSK